MQRFTVAAFLVLAGFVLLASPGHALDPADKCEAAKNKEAGKYASCRQAAEAKAIKKGGRPDYSKCDAKFSDKWAKAEAKGGADCPTTDDEESIQTLITSHTDTMAAILAGEPTPTGLPTAAATATPAPAAATCADVGFVDGFCAQVLDVSLFPPDAASLPRTIICGRRDLGDCFEECEDPHFALVDVPCLPCCLPSFSP